MSPLIHELDREQNRRYARPAEALIGLVSAHAASRGRRRRRDKHGRWRPRIPARFWAELIGGTTAGTTEGSGFAAARAPGGFAMLFQPRGGAWPDRQGQHLDLTVPWMARPAEVERAVGLDAVHRWDVLDEVQWTALADPEGNLFCLAEHSPT